MMKRFSFLLSGLILIELFLWTAAGRPAYAADRWSDPATWGGHLPAEGDAVRIPAGKTVLLDVSPPPLGGLDIEGTLIFDRRDLALTSKSVIVHHGRLEIGTEDDPFLQQVVITLTGDDPTQDRQLHGISIGTKVLAVMDGELDVHGRPHTANWTKLNATAMPGDTQLTLDSIVDWQPGQKIVLASSEIDMNQAELLTLTAVGGKTVTIAEPLRYRHWGQMQEYDGVPLDERGEVGLLSHNILFQSDKGSEAIGFGGHVMIMPGSTARIEGVEFDRMGQFNRLGRYPLHWHLARDAYGSYAKNNSIHDSIQRGLVVHGTNRLLVQGNVVCNTVGHSYMLEDGTETGNVFDGNLGLLTRRANLNNLNQNDLRAATFWVKSENNIFTRNVVAGAECNGFWFDESTGPLQEFRDNVVHSTMSLRGEELYNRNSGVFVDTSRRLADDESPLVGLTLYRNKAAMWGAPISDRPQPRTVSNALLADNGGGIFDISTVTDTVFVGRSALSEANPQPFSAGLQTQFGGEFTARNLTFINFAQRDVNVSPFDSFSAATPIDTHITLSGARLLNTDPLGLSGYIEDQDGSYTGTGAYTVVVPDRQAWMYTAADPLDASGTSRWCPELYNYGLIQFIDGRNYLSTPQGRSTLLIRSDGATAGILRIERNYGLILNRGFTYTLGADLSNLLPLRIFLLREVDPTGPNAVQLAIPAGDPPTRVARLDSPDDTVGRPLPAVGSLEELTDESYFYDSLKNVLYMIVTDAILKID